MNVLDECEAGKYINRVPYDVEKVPVDKENMTIKQAREHGERERERRHKQRRLRNEEEARIRAIFQFDLETEHGLVDHPKAERLFSLAWERGHSSGYSEVAANYGELAELLK